MLIMNTFNIAIIEDSFDIRENLYEYFHASPELNCVICSDSVESFLAYNSYSNAPDVILSDIGLPGKNGIEGIAMIKEKFPQADVVMFTVFNDRDQVFGSLCAGAVGYIVKGTPLEEIKSAIITIASGGSYMSSLIARKVIGFFAPSSVKSDKLTEREMEIVKLLAEGQSYKLMANELYLSVDTIRYHIKNIYKKLQVNSKAEVIHKLYKGNL